MTSKIIWHLIHTDNNSVSRVVKYFETKIQAKKYYNNITNSENEKSYYIESSTLETDMKKKIWHIVSITKPDDCDCYDIDIKSFMTERQAIRYRMNNHIVNGDFYRVSSELEIDEDIKILPLILRCSDDELLESIIIMPGREPAIWSFRASQLLGLTSESIETRIDANIDWFPEKFYYKPTEREKSIFNKNNNNIADIQEANYFITKEGMLCFLKHLQPETAKMVRNEIDFLFNKKRYKER